MEPVAINLNPGVKAVRSFILHSTFLKTPARRGLLYGYLILMGLALILMIAIAAYTKRADYALLLFGLWLLLALYGAIIFLAVRGTAKKLHKNLLSEAEPLDVILNDSYIVIRKNGAPAATIDWDTITDIGVTQYAGYLMTDQSALILFDFDQIIAGGKAQLTAILAAKSAALPKKKSHGK